MATIKASTQNRMARALGNQASAAEICDQIDVLASISLVEIGFLDGVTAGVAQAEKALVLDGSKQVDMLTVTGQFNAGSVYTPELNSAIGSIVVATALRTTVGVGAIIANKCTVVEGGDGVLHKVTFTFTLTGDHDLDLADGGDKSTGIKIYDFPAGDILILGATVNGLVTSVNAEGGGATFPLALGSAVASANEATLTGDEADIIPSVAVAGGSAKDWHGRLAAVKRFDNAAGSDVDLYVNAAILNTVSQGAVTIAITGTATITWINLGDY